MILSWHSLLNSKSLLAYCWLAEMEVVVVEISFKVAEILARLSLVADPSALRDSVMLLVAELIDP